ncbi:MAG: WbqC family protein [Candidatus Omnitrophica bacterium]|nr:WbqC family protein [Candidatus Omnitrophota bacterium]
MLVGIHQLHYLPWLRYIHKIASCDVFVILDTIQFNKNGWQNRNKIKTSQGAKILTVPVLHKRAQNLSEVEIDTKQRWAKKHWGTILAAYQKAPHFDEHRKFFEEIYSREWEKLNELNHEMLSYFVNVLGIKTKIVHGSDMELRGEATERLVNICKDLTASAYLTGAYAAEAYLEEELFKAAGISLTAQQFKCPEYCQQFQSLGFIPELAILDMLFNCGPRTLEILMQSGISSSALNS